MTTQFDRENTKKVITSPDGKRASTSSVNCADHARSPSYRATPANTLVASARTKVQSPRSTSKEVSSSPRIVTTPGSGLATATITPLKAPRTAAFSPTQKPTRTFALSSFQMEKLFKASTRDSVIFLDIANVHGFDFAARLAVSLHWNLRPSIAELQQTWIRLKRRDGIASLSRKPRKVTSQESE